MASSAEKAEEEYMRMKMAGTKIRDDDDGDGSAKRKRNLKNPSWMTPFQQTLPVHLRKKEILCTNPVTMTRRSRNIPQQRAARMRAVKTVVCILPTGLRHT